MTAMAYHYLTLILGDQLTPDVAALRESSPTDTVVLMAEVDEETQYVRHHQKKIAFLFSAMRHFAAELEAAGWRVDYTTLDAPDNSDSLFGEVQRAAARHGCREIRITAPGEWRLQTAMEAWEAQLGIPVRIYEDSRFIATTSDFNAWADGRKALRMEYFYREMRRKTGLLMDADQPAGGQWNFDHDNRKPATDSLFLPRPLEHPPDAITQAVLELVESRFGDHFGSLQPFVYAVTREQADASFRHFVATTLPLFGDYQDAMLTGEPFMYHAVIAQYLNCGLLDPLSVCRQVDAAYREGAVPINAAEGFIRQIIGWREYVRGIYWREGPDYVERNALGARRKLPGFFWTADTKMSCVRQAVEQTREHAYAHHIQRLMVTGNFALLAGIDPGELHRWYLAVYADAYEWVEAPNTLGMSQYADGGVLASKPYAASGAYIDRMSNYCRDCHYRVKLKAGPQACPFNILYWDFIARHAERFSRNARMGRIVSSYGRMSPERHRELREDAERLLAELVP